jgi:hypothetical protein
MNSQQLTTDHSILDLGPELKISSHIDAKFGLNNLKADVGVNYDLSGASFAFRVPSQEGSRSEGIRGSAKRESCVYLIIATLYPTQSI